MSYLDAVAELTMRLLETSVLLGLLGAESMQDFGGMEDYLHFSQSVSSLVE